MTTTLTEPTQAEIDEGAAQPDPEPVPEPAATEPAKKDATRPYIIFHEVQADVFKKLKTVVAANGEAAIKSLGDEEIKKLMANGVGLAATTERGWSTKKPKVETHTTITFE